jgi:hypothetical protein
MKKRPDVEVVEIVLKCPECGEILNADVCSECGCEIDLNEFSIDVQPFEILS